MARSLIDVPSDYNSNKEIVFNKLSLKDFTEKLQSACDFITNDSRGINMNGGIVVANIAIILFTYIFLSVFVF